MNKYVLKYTHQSPKPLQGTSDIMFNTLFFISEEHANIWGAWHTTLKPGLQEQPYTGTIPKMTPVLLY